MCRRPALGSLARCQSWTRQDVDDNGGVADGDTERSPFVQAAQPGRRCQSSSTAIRRTCRVVASRRWGAWRRSCRVTSPETFYTQPLSFERSHVKAIATILMLSDNVENIGMTPAHRQSCFCSGPASSPRRSGRSRGVRGCGAARQRFPWRPTSPLRSGRRRSSRPTRPVRCDGV